MKNILAAAISQAQAVTIVILCISVFVFVFANIILLLSIHRKNKKIAKSNRLTAPDEEEPEE